MSMTIWVVAQKHSCLIKNNFSVDKNEKQHSCNQKFYQGPKPLNNLLACIYKLVLKAF